MCLPHHFSPPLCTPTHYILFLLSLLIFFENAENLTGADTAFQLSLCRLRTLLLRHYLCKHGPNAPAQITPETADTPADEEEEEEDDGVDGAEAEGTPPSDSEAE